MRLHRMQSVLIGCFSADFERLSRMAPKVHGGGTESATARAARSLRQFRAQSESRDGYPGRRSQRLGAAFDVEAAAAVHGAGKRTAEAPDPPQCERLKRYGGSEHGQSSVLAGWGGEARYLRLHLMWCAPWWPPSFKSGCLRSWCRGRHTPGSTAYCNGIATRPAVAAASVPCCACVRMCSR